MLRGSPAQQRVKNFIERIPWQAKDLLHEPGIPPLPIRILRASLMLEECMETIQKGLGLDIHFDVAKVKDNALSLTSFAVYGTVNFEDLHFEPAKDRQPSLIEIADGLADQEVVNLGTAESCCLDLQPVFDEVMDNNDLKIQNGSFNDLGKLVKPPGHPAPDIKKVLLDQGWKDAQES